MRITHTANAGYGSIVLAGDYGAANGGSCATAITGDYGTAQTRFGGTSIAGMWGTAIAGGWGTATAGIGGTAAAGDRGVIIIRDADGCLHVGRIGENGLRPDTRYRLNRAREFEEVDE